MGMDPRAVVSGRVAASPRLGLLLDYDGTLVPLRFRPELAVPDDELLTLLARLARRPGTDVHVVSGRPRDELEAMLGGLPLGLHAEHGLWSRRAYGTWRARQPLDAPWRETVAARLDASVRRVAGSWLQRKSVGFAWHWRMAVVPEAQREMAALRAEFAALADDGLELLEGNGIFEVRPAGSGKDVVVRELTSAAGARLWIAAGDDRTDEELFAALPPAAIRIKVGGGHSLAELRVGDPDEMRLLLRALLE